MSVSLGCELEVNGKNVPTLPVFNALKPAAGRVQPGSQTGTLLVPPVLNTSEHLYQHSHATACGLNTKSETGVSELSFRRAVL